MSRRGAPNVLTHSFPNPLENTQKTEKVSTAPIRVSDNNFSV